MGNVNTEKGVRKSYWSNLSTDLVQGLLEKTASMGTGVNGQKYNEPGGSGGKNSASAKQLYELLFLKLFFAIVLPVITIGVLAQEALVPNVFPCNEHSVFQAHALWHCCVGLSIFLTYLVHRSEDERVVVVRKPSVSDI